MLLTMSTIPSAAEVKSHLSDLVSKVAGLHERVTSPCTGAW
jgi:hypothetical protein